MRVPTEELDRLVKSLGPVHVQIDEYSISHAHLRLRLIAAGHFKRTADILFADCLHISGPTYGGPWDCAVAEYRQGRDTRIIFIGGVDFVAHALRAEFIAAADPM